MFYIANKGLSLLENAVVFIPIPEKLRDVFLQIREKDSEHGSGYDQKHDSEHKEKDRL